MPSYSEFRVLRMLASFISQGQGIQGRCLNVREPAPEEDARQWKTEVEQFLGTDVDPLYIDRFRNPAGLPYPVVEVDAGRYPNHAKVWTEIYFRVARLELFSQELSHSHLGDQ